MINILVKVKNVMNKILSAASVVLLVFMTSLVLWQVFTRYVLGKPAAFTEELVKYSLMWTAFIGAAYAFFTRDHMSLTIIKDKLTGNKRKILLLVIDVLILLLAVFVFVIGGFKLAMSARAEYSALLGIPMNTCICGIPVSGIFIVVAQIINIYEDLTGVIEYSSPNTNKPLHLGHVRNNLLGNALANIVAANGNKVVKTNIVNDRGIHICKSMLAWQKYGNGETPESSGKKGDHLIGDYYVSFDKHYKAEVKELMAKFQSEGMNEEEAKAKAEAESPLMKEAREMLVKWEANDPEVRALWKKMNDWVYAGLTRLTV